jgi:hypothetical protein
VICKTTGDKGWLLLLDGSTLVMFFRDATSDSWKSVEAEYITQGAWTHVVAMRNDVGDMKLYVNASLAETRRMGELDLDSSDLVIGYDEYGDGSFTGRIDEVAIYARALSYTEISQHYAAGTP